MSVKDYIEKFKEHHFEFKHLTVLFIVLLCVQLVVSFINKASITNFLNKTQDWYQEDSAEKLANLTSTSLELIIESIAPNKIISTEEQSRLIQSFNIIFSQQMLQHNIEEICILVTKGESIYAIDEGSVLFDYFYKDSINTDEKKLFHNNAVNLYQDVRDELKRQEQIKTITYSDQVFHVFVPFVIRGEYVGAVYVKDKPNFSLITDQIISNYDETTIIYVSLILLGFIAMYFISSYTVKERNEAQQRLFEEHEENLKKQITFDKELTFTKRIYHAHHKAEKVMGFIKEDLRKLNRPDRMNEAKINDINNRMIKYSNFISRVIYDMKWYDPPLQTVRSSIYNTNLNDVLEFLVNNIFKRVSNIADSYSFNLKFDKNLPKVHINEFVVWEMFEPLIQNSIDHGGKDSLIITITTEYNENDGSSTITISDNGVGINEELLKVNEEGLKNIFLENVTTKHTELKKGGYGCYIAYQISKRCGWNLDAVNNPGGGCSFVIIIKHN